MARRQGGFRMCRQQQDPDADTESGGCTKSCTLPAEDTTRAPGAGRLQDVVSTDGPPSGLTFSGKCEAGAEGKQERQNHARAVGKLTTPCGSEAGSLKGSSAGGLTACSTGVPAGLLTGLGPRWSDLFIQTQHRTDDRYFSIQ